MNLLENSVGWIIFLGWKEWMCCIYRRARVGRRGVCDTCRILVFGIQKRLGSYNFRRCFKIKGEEKIIIRMWNEDNGDFTTKDTA